MGMTVNGTKTDAVCAHDLANVHGFTGPDMWTGHTASVRLALKGDGYSAKPRAATWEGTVLPALRAALDQYPETLGWKAAKSEGNPLRVVVEKAMPRNVRLPGIRAYGNVRRDTLEHVTQDAQALARKAAEAARQAAPEAPLKPPCPVCQAIAGWAPACTTCRGGGETVPPDPLGQPERTPLPQGWVEPAPWVPQVGDRVVLQTWEDAPGLCNMLPAMRLSVGNIATVLAVSDGHADTDAGWWWPTTAMRPAH